MRFLRQNTATRLTVGPFFDVTDGVTPEVALTVTNEKLTFVVDDGGVPTLVIDTAPSASGGANDMVHVTDDDAGFYDLEVTAAQTNYLGRAMLALTDAVNHRPVSHEFMILPAAVYDAFFGASKLPVDLDTIKTQTVTCGAGVTVRADVGTAAASTAQTGDSFARLGAPAGASLSADVAAVKVDTAAILTDTGTDGVVVAAASKAGYTLSAAGVQAIWDALSSALTVVGSIGKRLVDYLTGDAFARLGAPAGASLSADVAAVKAKTELIPAAGPADAAHYTPARAAKLDGIGGAVASVTAPVTVDSASLTALQSEQLRTALYTRKG